MIDRVILAAPSRLAYFQDQLPNSKINYGDAVHPGSGNGWVTYPAFGGAVAGIGIRASAVVVMVERNPSSAPRWPGIGCRNAGVTMTSVGGWPVRGSDCLGCEPTGLLGDLQCDATDPAAHRSSGQTGPGRRVRSGLVVRLSRRHRGISTLKPCGMLRRRCGPNRPYGTHRRPAGGTGYSPRS